MKRNWLVLLGLGVGCGGDQAGPTPPPPPAVVTSVEVTSPTTSLFVLEDTVQLSATVRDQRGAIMPGKTLTWSSANPAIVSVSSEGKAVGLAAGNATVSVTVEGKSGGLALAVAIPGPRVTLEIARAASRTFGPGGGSLTATSNAGIEYTLEVPDGALITPQQLTMTPIASVRKLGLSGGLAGAVKLEPSGFTFARPALLRIRTAQTAPPGTQLVGFLADDEFAERSLALAAGQGGEVVVVVPHFSSSGAGFGTSTDIRAFPAQVSASLQTLLGQVLNLQPVPWDPAAKSQADALIQQMFQQFIRPALNTAADDFALITAIDNYEAWRRILALFGDNGVTSNSAFAPDAFTLPVPAAFLNANQEAVDAAAIGFKLAVDGNIELCGAQNSLAALKNVFFWFKTATRLGVADPAHQLDLPTVQTDIENRCAKVALLSNNLPPALVVGTQFDLDLRFGLEYRNFTKEPTDFQVTLTASGFDPITSPTGLTGLGDTQSPLGAFKRVIRANTQGQIALSAEACLVLTDRVPPQPDPTPRFTSICSTFDLTPCSVAAIAVAPSDGICEEPPAPPPPPASGDWVGDFSYVDQSGQHHAARITARLGTGGLPVSGTWSLDDGIHSGTMTFSVGGIDPVCPGCGFLIENFVMTGTANGAWGRSGGAHHACEPQRGSCLVMDLRGSDDHVHSWNARFVLAPRASGAPAPVPAAKQP